MATLKENQIVVLRNGKIGVVTGFNGKPAQIVFDSFTKPARSFDPKTFVVNGNNRGSMVITVSMTSLRCLTQGKIQNIRKSLENPLKLMA